MGRGGAGHAGPPAGAVVEHMADGPLIALELKEEGKGIGLVVNVLHQDLGLLVKGFVEDILPEAVRNDGNLEGAAVSIVGCRDKVGHVIGIKRLCVALGVHGQRDGPRDGDGGSKRGISGLVDGERRVVSIFQAVLDLVLHISHFLHLDFKN